MVFVDLKKLLCVLFFCEVCWVFVGFWGIFVLIFGGVGFGIFGLIFWVLCKEVEEE